MLKRIYVHNYKCLVNFEINFDKDISLFLGANGSGKTTVLSALYEIQKFVFFDIRLDDKWLNQKDRIFKSSTLTRWGEDLIQKFEIEIEADSGVYKYELEIEHNPEKTFPRVKTENLFLNGQALYKFCITIEEGGKTQIGSGKVFKRGKSKKDGDFYAINWFSSGLGSMQERNDNKELIWFKKWLAKLFVVHINPSAMKFDMEAEEIHPELDLSNYVSWLSHWNNENREGVHDVENELKEIIKGFSSFRFYQAGINRILEFKINKLFYRFDELSDGQKALAALYTLIYCVPENSVICIDEPENFLGLPEIQPWLNALREQCKERKIQCLLISHHPSLINFLATNSGYWFSRQESHTRQEKISKPDDGGLSLAQLIEAGWIYGN